MSKDTDQTSGVVGGTMDVSGDTTTEEPGEVIDQILARRHQAEARGRQAAKRILRARRAQNPSPNRPSGGR
jgi:hypothetical protein